MRYPNKEAMNAILSCMDGRMTIREIAESSGVSRRKVPAAMKALQFQGKVRAKRMDGRVMWNRTWKGSE